MTPGRPTEPPQRCTEELARYRAADAPVAADRIAESLEAPFMATMAAGNDHFTRGAIATIVDD